MSGNIMRATIVGFFFSGILAIFGACGAELLSVGDFVPSQNNRGIPEGWQLKERSGVANVTLVQDQGRHALHLQSSNTSFSLQRELKADLGEFPVLTWDWKVTKLPTGGDFRRAKTDDQAAQLFVAFNRTQSIVYLWDTSAPEGYTGAALAPPLMSIKVVVVRSRPDKTGRWLTETRNVYEDYQKLFGPCVKPPVVSGMRIQINTQHTKTSAESFFADVKFKKKDA